MGFGHLNHDDAPEGGAAGLVLDLEDEEGDELYDADATATVQISTHQGSIRALCLQLHNTPPTQSATILDGYHALARNLKATVTASENIDWD